MARIQHRDIPDPELHELKGAAGAIQGSVPVADGLGSTTFQKVGVSSLSGSIPTGVADLIVATDGTGGFKTLTPAFGRFQTTKAGSVFNTTAIITPAGFSLFGDGFRVANSGYYWYAVEGLTYVPSPAGVVWANLVNSTAGGATVSTSLSGIVFLTTDVTYRLDDTSSFSLWKITA